MAFGMKHWIVATLLGCALVAVWRLPPEPPELRDEEVPTAEELRWDALRSDERVSTEVLYRMLWADSLSERVVAEADDGVAVLAPPAGEGTREQLRRFEAAVRRQVEERASPSDAMVFGFVFQPHDQSQDGARFSGRDRTETYVGARNGVAYCLQVRVAHATYIQDMIARRVVDDDSTPPFTDHLGPCRFYLAYGLAGDGVQDWLDGGGVELGMEDGSGPPVWEGARVGRRGPLGFTSFLGYGQSTEITRCLAGIAESCGAFLENRDDAYFLTDQQLEIARRSPVTGVGARYRLREWFGDQAYLLADLESEFGADAFRAFWTSDAPMPRAFEVAFGVDTGTWMVSWVDRAVGVDRPGPGLPRKASTGAMLTVGLLLGIAWWRQRERSVAG